MPLDQRTRSLNLLYSLELNRPFHPMQMVAMRNSGHLEIGRRCRQLNPRDSPTTLLLKLESRASMASRRRSIQQAEDCWQWWWALLSDDFSAFNFVGRNSYNSRLSLYPPTGKLWSEILRLMRTSKSIRPSRHQSRMTNKTTCFKSDLRVKKFRESYPRRLLSVSV